MLDSKCVSTGPERAPRLARTAQSFSHVASSKIGGTPSSSYSVPPYSRFPTIRGEVSILRTTWLFQLVLPLGLGISRTVKSAAIEKDASPADRRSPASCKTLTSAGTSSCQSSVCPNGRTLLG